MPHRPRRHDPSDDNLPADPTTRAALAAEVDRWWRDLPLNERLAMHMAHQDKHARGLVPPV